LTDLIATYEPGGTTPYHPRMLLKVVFYAYMNNLYSCRRSEHVKDCINRLFVQVVTLLVEIGQVSLDVMYVDGTKIESVVLSRITLLKPINLPHR
jgi:transposase